MEFGGHTKGRRVDKPDSCTPEADLEAAVIQRADDRKDVAGVWLSVLVAIDGERLGRLVAIHRERPRAYRGSGDASRAKGQSAGNSGDNGFAQHELTPFRVTAPMYRPSHPPA